MPKLQDLPVEVLIDYLFRVCYSFTLSPCSDLHGAVLMPAILSVRSILNLGVTNRFFLGLTNDNTFWKRKLECEFNFSGKDTARTTGWKRIYMGMLKPMVFYYG